MTITASIHTDFYAIILLILTICLAAKNPIGNKHNNKIYITMSVLTIVLLVLEISTVLIGLSSNPNLVTPHRIANVLGFSLCPLVPYILYSSSHERKKGEKYLLCTLPLLINVIVSILSYRTGWVFFVDEKNLYYRGSLFLIPMLTSVFYFVLLLLEIKKKNIFENKNEYNKFIFMIFSFPMLGAILQILFMDVLLIWGNMAVSLLVYYILLREQQFRYDVQTGIKNRLAFEKEMDKYIRNPKNAALVVLDVNYLKKINDRYGHKVGDEVIINAAKVIQKSFMTIGDAFRIGGDEFCVICEDASREQVDAALGKLEKELTEINKERKIKIKIAYGYEFYRKRMKESIYSIFSKADYAMYEHKAKSKGLYGRRITD